MVKDIILLTGLSLSSSREIPDSNQKFPACFRASPRTRRLDALDAPGVVKAPNEDGLVLAALIGP